ncbi:hypothetical protein D9757_004266 [Collybiopsis confluens]|uniref:F-box domain-containing protein n=1 Tax=Collybiopsis confluens TaxID=2823264 RepID=A0A8H5HU74_9AGAR|nr:hypothetical protein D9757_004266 [Collybiopsis confluens]
MLLDHPAPPIPCPFISSLPVEILSDIFIVGQSIDGVDRDNECDSDCVEFEQSPAPPFEVRLTQVCSQWRLVAINTGQLWSRISVGPGYSPAAVRVYLERSRECLLDVCLQSCPSASTTNQVLDAVFQQSVRWRACTLEGDMDSLIMSKIVALPVPTLRVFRCTVQPPMRTRRLDEVWENRLVFESGKGCPALKAVILHSFAVHFALPPLTNVTKLQLDYLGRLPLKYDRFRELLTNCRSLVHLSIRGEITDSSLPWPSKVDNSSAVVVPRLSTLRISSLSSNVYSGILLSIDAPLLRSLILEGAQEMDLDRFLRLGTPCRFTRLRSLALYRSSLTPSKLSEVYTLFPLLDEIIAEGFMFDPTEVITRVTETITDLGLDPLPFLKHKHPSTTLGVMLNQGQRVYLEQTLEQDLLDEQLDVDYDSGWTFHKFFGWLLTFITVEALVRAKEAAK